MDEYWVCQHCRSLNRAGAGKCYSCKNGYGSKPKEPAPGHAPAAGAPPPPPPMVSMPNLGGAPSPAPYISRPALTSVPVQPRAVPGQPQREFNKLKPVGASRPGIAARIAMRPTLPATALGYLTALLLILVVVGGAMLVLNLLPAASYMLQYMNPSDSWGQLSAAQHSTVQTLGIGVGVLSLVTLICFSVFLGFTTHNATGLGADQPLLTPSRAGWCWVSALWAQVRIAIGLIVPALIIWKGYTIPGLIAMVVTVEIAQRNLDDALGWLERPARHLPDLYAKLGIEGSISSPLATFWSVSFRIANVLAIAVAALPVLGLALSTGSSLANRTDVIGWRTDGLGIDQLAIALLVGLLAGWVFASVGMLVPLTIGLVQRQRTRKTLVRVGRSRSWVARPGEGSYAPASPRLDPYSDDPEDRIVERMPQYAGDDLPDAGGPGFGAPRPAAPFAAPAAGGLLGRPVPSNPYAAQQASGPFGGPGQGGLLGGQTPGVVGRPGTSPFGGPAPSSPFPGQPAPFGRPAPAPQDNPFVASSQGAPILGRPQGGLLGVTPPPGDDQVKGDPFEPPEPDQTDWGPDSERIG